VSTGEIASARVPAPGGAAGPGRASAEARPPLQTVPVRPARPAGSPVLQAPTRTRRRIVLAIFGLLAAVNLGGLPYYTLSNGQRLRSEFHVWLKPTGYLGQSAGFLSLGLFLFLWLYPLRKKFRWLEWTGSIAKWLDVHVVIGLMIPILAAQHGAWKFRGLIGLGYLAMLIVALSGIVGRYLYMHIPRSRNGLEMTLDQVAAQRQEALQQIARATAIDPAMLDQFLAVPSRPYAGLGPVRTLFRMLGDDFRRWKATRQLRRILRRSARGATPRDRAVLADAFRLARRQMALGQQIRMLDATQRLFRYWHIAHRPFAITALVAVLLHVVSAIVLGVTWVG
jgi:hypothetical protein